MKELSPGEKRLAQELRKITTSDRWAKKRAWNEKRFSALSIVVLSVVFLLLILFLTVFPRPTVSDIENRRLNTFPKFSLASYFSGDFTSEVAAWYDDTVPYRDSFKNAGNTFKQMFGFSTRDTIVFINQDVVAQDMNGGSAKSEADGTPEVPAATPAETPPGSTGTLIEEPASAVEPTASPSPTPSPTPKPQKDYTAEDAEFDVDIGNSIILVYQEGHWRALSMFGGGSGNSYVSGLNTLHERLGSGVTIYSMPAPLSSQYYTPANALGYTTDQEACFQSIADRLDDGIVTVDICSLMQAHTEEPIYLRTDHHWAPLGAYYAAGAFAEAAGVDFADLSEYDRGVNEGYVGTMYAFSGDTRILYDPEDFIYYKPTNDFTTYYYDHGFNYLYEADLFEVVSTDNSYLMFMGGDDNIVKIVSSNRNGRKLLVIKDSYGNAEIPFYTGSFEEVYVADMRYFRPNLVNFIQDRGITDVLFTMCSYSVVGGNADNIQTLIDQNAGEHLSDGAPAPTPLPAAPALSLPADENE